MNGDEKKAETADCYSEGERKWMIAFQEWKQRWLRPLLELLEKLNIRPGHVTLFSLLLGLAFCPLFLVAQGGWTMHLAFLLLVFHLLVDGIDGPLARHLDLASKRGSITDTAADQTVIAITTLTLMYSAAHGGIGLPIFCGGCYLFFYTCVVCFAMIRNALSVPYSFVVRPRNFVYAWLFLEVYFFQGTQMANSIVWLVWICNALLAWKTWTGFDAIRDSA